MRIHFLSILAHSTKRIHFLICKHLIQLNITPTHKVNSKTREKERKMHTIRFTYIVQSMFIPLEDLINLAVKMHSLHWRPPLDHHDILVRKITYHVYLKKRLPFLDLCHRF